MTSPRTSTCSAIFRSSPGHLHSAGDFPPSRESVPLTPGQLGTTSTHVIRGKVTAVDERTESTGDWKDTKDVAEVRVEDCEKGDGVEKGDLADARDWQKEWVGKGQAPPSASRHEGLPSDGETLRVYMARDATDGFGENKDGGFSVIGPNGFEKLKPGSNKWDLSLRTW